MNESRIDLTLTDFEAQEMNSETVPIPNYPSLMLPVVTACGRSKGHNE